MSFEQGMLRELADVVVFDRWRSQRSQARADESIHDVPHIHSLLLVRSEILLAAPLIATVSCLANLLETDATGGDTADILGHYVPDVSQAIRPALAALQADNRFFSLIGCWQRLDGQLRLANALTRALSASARSSVERPHIDAEAVADAWRRVARLCLDIHAKIEAKLNADGVSIDNDGDIAALALFEDAARGGTGCLDASGLVSIAQHAERRQSKRIKVSIAANIVADGTNHPATIVDASETGIGLRSDAPLKVGEPISVQLPNGRNLEGAVVWGLRDRAGMRLEVRLSVDDAIFGGRILKTTVQRMV